MASFGPITYGISASEPDFDVWNKTMLLDGNSTLESAMVMGKSCTTDGEKLHDVQILTM